MCRTLRFMTPALMERERIYLRIKDLKEQIDSLRFMDILPEDLKAEMREYWSKELQELELQLTEMEFDIYSNASS